MPGPKTRKAQLGFSKTCSRCLEIASVLAVVGLTALQLIYGNLIVLSRLKKSNVQTFNEPVEQVRSDALDVIGRLQPRGPTNELTHENDARAQPTLSNKHASLQEILESAARVVQTSMENDRKQGQLSFDNVLDREQPSEVSQVMKNATQKVVVMAQNSTSDDSNDTTVVAHSGPTTTVTSFQNQVLARVAQDTVVRKQAFIKRYIDCKTESGTQPIGETCALKLQVPDNSANSLNFDYMNDKLERDQLWISNPFYNSATSQRKTILVWRIVWSSLSPNLPETIRECPACRFTVNESEHDVDAIVMSSHAVWRSNFSLTLPTREEYPRAKMVVYEYEAPFRSGSRGFTGLSDYSFSYRRDADIVKTNGYVKLRTSPISWDDIVARNAKKFKMVAWFVSNCDYENSQRSLLTKSLRKHGVRVDIYGRCGTLQCPKRDNKCLEMLDTDYKFYFSFENSLCNHYVTEKFYKALTHSVIPITYGLGHELTGAPKSSYIDVFDFADIKSLADHILYLDSNATAYNEYFRWQLTYEVDTLTRLRGQICQLCQKLVEGIEPKRQYPDFESWATEGQCVDVNINSTVGKFIRDLPWR